MKGFALGLLLALAALAAGAAYVWYLAPEHLPEGWRRDNPNAADYAPAVYRWKDDRGVVQLTDAPPADRPYETVRVDPDTNVVPLGTPPRDD